MLHYPKIDPVAVHLGPIEIHWYGIMYVVGFAASLQFLGLGNSGELMWGTMLYNAQQAAALESGNVWWELAPGAAVALMGAGFALVNYAFDEIGNPALRPVRRRKRRAPASP